MSIGLLLPAADHIDPVPMAERAEQLGYDAVWIPELWGRSAPVVASRIAGQTEHVTIGTAILNVFSRSPAVLAMTAASLAEYSEDRFVLGLGTSTQKAVEDLHGMAFDRPVRRAHETVAAIRRFTVGTGTTEYSGDLFDLSDFPSLDRDVPLFAAALGPANRRMVGRLCDGWIPHNVPFATLDAAFETVADAARDAGRDPDDIVVSPYVPTAVSDDLDRAQNAIRGHIAYYVGSGSGYRRAVTASFPDAASTIAREWAAGNRENARDHVTDAMVAALGVAATPETAAAQFDDQVSRSVIDRPILVVPSNAPALVDQTIEAVIS